MKRAKEKERIRKISQLLAKAYPGAKIALRYKTNWELLVAVILSAQCTDKKVNEVTARRFKKYRTLEDYVRAKPKAILTTAKILKEKFNGRVPKTMQEMLTLRGVARKTANVVLGNAYGVIEGIAVDTHVRRLSNRLGLSEHSDPVKIEQDLMKLFPRKEWPSLTYRLIDHGRSVCSAKDPRCDLCPLSDICPSAFSFPRFKK